MARAQDFDGADFDLVTMFDALHDMGDPVGAVAHARKALKPDGTLMLVEPMAGDSLAENLNPVGRVYYASSTHICVPTSLNQEVGAALGAQAGAKRLGEVIREGRVLAASAKWPDAVQHGARSAPLSATQAVAGHIEHWTSKEENMSLLFHAGSSGTITSSYRRTAAILLRRACRLIDSWVAATIARRERQIMKAMLNRFSDRALKDIGICRGEIDFALSDTSRILMKRLRP